LAFLHKRSKQLDAVVISGGEPTLQPDLPGFCRQARGLGYKIKLDTNGTRPKMLTKLLDDQLLDYVAMDIKAVPEAYSQLSPEPQISANIRESIRIINKRSPAYEFRTTCVRPFISKEAICSIGRLISGAPRYFLQKCRQTDVMDPNFFRVNFPPQTDLEIETLQTLVAPQVANCTIR
jgi:pyruvate formate lyase activating enzyme